MTFRVLQCIALFASFPLLGQTPVAPVLVSPTTEVSIRATPPTGALLGGVGKEVGKADVNSVYVGLGGIETRRGLSTETWVRIAPVMSLIDRALVATASDVYSQFPDYRPDAEVVTVTDSVARCLESLTWKSIAPNQEASADSQGTDCANVSIDLSPRTVQLLNQLRETSSNADSNHPIFGLDYKEILKRTSAAKESIVFLALNDHSGMGWVEWKKAPDTDFAMVSLEQHENSLLRAF